MKPGQALGRRALRAGAWAAGSHFAAQALRLAGNLVLTRLLLPEAFGLMAVISTLMMALNLLSDIGGGTVVVQSERGTEEAFVNTAWTLQAMRGVLIWLLSVLASLGIAFGQAQQWFRDGTVYDDPRLPLLIAVATFAMVPTGFISLKIKLAERRLDLRRVSAIELGVQLVALVAMAIGAVHTASVWALVFGGIFAAALKCLCSHVLLPGPRSRFRLERSAVQEQLDKGKWVMVSSVLGFAAMNGDRLLLGGLIDGTTLGLYSIAFGLASIAYGSVSALLGKVIFPAFSEVVRHRPEDLGTVYRKFQQSADALIGLLGGFMIVCADLLIQLLYDPRYEGAGRIFGLLAIGTIGVRFLVAEQIYVAMGRTGLLAAAILPRAIIVFAGLPLGYAIAGFDGALVAVVASYFGHWPTAIWFRAKHGLNRLRNDMVLPASTALGLLCGWLVLQGVAALSSA